MKNSGCPNGQLFTNIVAKFGTTVKEVLDQYMLRVYGTTNKKLIFENLAKIRNREINRYENRVIEDYFKNNDNPVRVSEIP